jgi:hypothetical protein
VSVLFTQDEAAELVEIKPSLLKLWLETAEFKTSTTATSSGFVGGTETAYYFNEDDIQRLTEFAAQRVKRKTTSNETFIDDGKQETFTVAEIASLWRLSTDTVQRIFEDEPGVIALGNKNPRGRRKRITLRIPRAVMERVKKTRSNAR